MSMRHFLYRLQFKFYFFFLFLLQLELQDDHSSGEVKVIGSDDLSSLKGKLR